MFVRIKKIKGHKYAYLVENEWTKKGARQKVKAYLGKVIPMRRELDLPFEKAINVLSFKDAVIELAKWELKKNGFKEITDKGVLKKDKYVFDPQTLQLVMKKKKGKLKNIVFAMNEGFFCEATLQQLLKFKGTGNQDQVGLQFARAVVAAGLHVPKPIFVALFGKVFND